MTPSSRVRKRASPVTHYFPSTARLPDGSIPVWNRADPDELQIALLFDLCRPTAFGRPAEMPVQRCPELDALVGRGLVEATGEREDGFPRRRIYRATPAGLERIAVERPIPAPHVRTDISGPYSRTVVSSPAAPPKPANVDTRPTLQCPDDLVNFGYSPGGYVATCRQCRERIWNVDKRAWHCEPCAADLRVRSLTEASLDGFFCL
jgi:hypothetical protein